MPKLFKQGVTAVWTIKVQYIDILIRRERSSLTLKKYILLLLLFLNKP